MLDLEIILNELQSKFESVYEIEGYVKLRFIREVELLISEQYSEQIFRCPVHLSVGQEGVAVGVTMRLNPEDKVISTHRSHAHYLAKGGSLFKMFAELMGIQEGCCGGRGGSMHLQDSSVGFMGSIPIVGSSLPISLGLAYSEKMLHSNNIAVAFVGDAVLETGAFYETLNLMALKELPLLLVIEDNGYSTFADKSIRVPKRRETEKIVKGFGISFFSANGDLLKDVLDVCDEVVPLVRENQPVVLEVNTFRFLEHCGPNNDDALGYRDPRETSSYPSRDPIIIAKNNLLSNLSREKINTIDTVIGKYIINVYNQALKNRNKEFSLFLREFAE